MVHKAKTHTALLCTPGTVLLPPQVFPGEKSPSATSSSSTVDRKRHEGGGLRRYHLIKLVEDAVRILNEVRKTSGHHNIPPYVMKIMRLRLHLNQAAISFLQVYVCNVGTHLLLTPNSSPLLP